MKVVLEGTKSDGKKFRKEIETAIEKLYLSVKELATVDLSPLAQCTKLQWLDLAGNQLAAVDLSPLEKCTELRWLWLNNNQLAELDLSPLEKCKELKGLYLDGNLLPSVDLSPLQKCKKLQRLDLRARNLDFFTTIRWGSPNLTIAKLPEGLQEYQEEIQQAWEEFTKPERERR